MTFEARIGFLIFFFAVWCLMGLLPWAVSAVVARGRRALPALPLALAAASAAGVLVPFLGARDLTGFFISLVSALLGSAAASVCGIAIARRVTKNPGA
ncbi:MAG: hypothetical protein ACRDH5_18800 [bacterium]